VGYHQKVFGFICATKYPLEFKEENAFNKDGQ
jgi:hypothetical protein